MPLSGVTPKEFLQQVSTIVPGFATCYHLWRQSRWQVDMPVHAASLLHITSVLKLCCPSHRDRTSACHLCFPNIFVLLQLSCPVCGLNHFPKSADDKRAMLDLQKVVDVALRRYHSSRATCAVQQIQQQQPQQEQLVQQHEQQQRELLLEQQLVHQQYTTWQQQPYVEALSQQCLRQQQHACEQQHETDLLPFPPGPMIPAEGTEPMTPEQTQSVEHVKAGVATDLLILDSVDQETQGVRQELNSIFKDCQHQAGHNNDPPEDSPEAATACGEPPSALVQSTEQAICSSAIRPSTQDHRQPATPPQILVEPLPRPEGCHHSSRQHEMQCRAHSQEGIATGFAAACNHTGEDQLAPIATPGVAPAVAAKGAAARRGSLAAKHGSSGQKHQQGSGPPKQKTSKQAEDVSGQDQGPQLKQEPKPFGESAAEQQYVACTARNIISMLLPKQWIRPLWALELFLAGESMYMMADLNTWKEIHSCLRYMLCILARFFVNISSCVDS